MKDHLRAASASKHPAVASLLASLALVLGCGGQDQPRPAAVTSPEQAPAVQAEPQPAPHDVASTTPEPAAEPLVDSQSIEREQQARKHFDLLTSTTVTPDEWSQAQQALVELGADAVPVLTSRLDASDAYVRETAVTILAMIGPQSRDAETALLDCLHDESIHVKANAATALCLIPGHEEQVIPVLTQLLQDDDPQLRQMAATNLGNFGPEAAPFVSQLATLLENGPDDVRIPVAEILGRIGPQARSAAPQLQQIAFEDEGEASQAANAALQRIIPPDDE